MVYLEIYDVNIPAVAKIYIKQFRDIIEFKILSPDGFLEMFFGIKNFDMMDWIMGADTIVDADQKKSPLQSMKIYIMMAAAGLVFMVLLCVIMLYNPCREKMKKKLIAIKKGFIFNGFFRSFYISLMKQWQSVAQ